jgi:hypothetical protein
MPLQFIGYLLISFVGAFVLTTIVSLFRKIKDDNKKTWHILAIFFVLVGLAPYGWAEYVTNQHGKDMNEAIESALIDAEIDGPIVYYKVMSSNESTARVVVVAREVSIWGDRERTVVSLDLESDDEGWFATSYKIVNSFQRGKDESTFPPYW